MRDKELNILFRRELLAGLALVGMPDVLVATNFQPTTQGRPTESTIYYHHVGDQHYGWQGRKNSSPNGNTLQRKETQTVATTLQVMAQAKAEPSGVSLLTAKDLLEVAAMICASQGFIEALTNAGCGVQRVTQIRNVSVVNEAGLFEFFPSFDVTITHERTLETTAPAAERITHKTYVV